MSDFMDEPLDIPDDLKDNDFVKLLTSRMAELTAKMDEIKVGRKAIVDELKEAKEKKKDFIREVELRLQSLQGEVLRIERLEQEADAAMLATKELHRHAKAELSSSLEGAKAHQELMEQQAAWDMILEDQDWLWVKSIFHFQKIGCEFIASGLSRDLFGILLADQMGLGKTLQATAAINLLQYQEDFEDCIAARLPETPLLYPPTEQPVGVGEDGEIITNLVHPPEWYPVLWITPNSIKSSTMREIAKWSSDLQVTKLEGDPGTRGRLVDMAFHAGMVLVCSYEQLRKRKEEDLTPEIFEHDWPIVILDEAHRFKNPDTSTFQAVERIMKRAGYVVPMTGTPIMNRPGEFWAMLHMITMKGKYKDKFDQYWKFERDYLNTWGYQNSFKIGGYDNLINGVKDMVLRRRKDEVLEDLPDKTRQIHYVNIRGRQRELYQQMRDKFFVWLDEEHSGSISSTSILAQLTRLRQIALYPDGVKITNEDGSETILDGNNESAKIEEAMAIIEEMMEINEKVLVFANFNDPLKEIQRRIEALDVNYERVTSDGIQEVPIETAAIIGGVKDDQRDDISHRFNDPDSSLRVVVGNIAAMGVGLNLQEACSHAIFLDLGWNPAVNEQAEDRLHRQGQKSNVTIHIIQAEDTVDEFVAAKVAEKQGVINEVMERGELRKTLEGLI